MDFEWDERKNAKNIERHGIDFEDAALVFDGPAVIKKSPFQGEDRWLATGFIAGRCVTVVYTIREGRCRIISARRARKNERP